MRRLLKVIAVATVLAGVSAGLVVVLAGQGLDRAEKWVSLAGVVVSVMLSGGGLALGWLTWRQGRPEPGAGPQGINAHRSDETGHRRAATAERSATFDGSGAGAINRPKDHTPPTIPGRRALVYALVSIIVVLLGASLTVVIVNASDEHPDAAARGDAGATTGVGATTGAPPSPTPPKTTSAGPDPVDRAFAATKKGNCLTGYLDAFGDGQPDSDEKPEVVPCTAPEAYYRVTQVLGVRGSCPGAGGGSAEWTHLGQHGVTLCIDRQFRTGQCFKGAGGGELQHVFLLHGWDCAENFFPTDWDYLVEVVAILGPDQGRNCPYTYSMQALHDTVTLCFKLFEHVD